MARFVRRTKTSPHIYKLESGETISICACGLTKNEFGLCDGSHHTARTEDPELDYVYDESNDREEVSLIDDADLHEHSDDDDHDHQCACGNSSCGCGNHEHKHDDKDHECRCGHKH